MKGRFAALFGLDLSRVIAVSVVVGTVVAASGLGAYFFYSMQGDANVEESLTATEVENVSWNGTMYPGETASTRFDYTNTQEWDGETYAVRIVLENFSDVRGSGLDEARMTSRDGYVSTFLMDDEWGNNYSFLADLLNDGVATYHLVEADQTIDGNLSVSLERRASVDGDVNVTVRFARVDDAIESSIVRMHNASSGECGTCHDGSLAAAVHLSENLTKSQSDCSSCHGLSTQDIHQTCTACHDVWPIPAKNGPYHGYSGSYSATLPPTGTCSTTKEGGCHLGYGETITHRDTGEWGSPLNLSTYCGQCHSNSTGEYSVSELNLTTFHGTDVIGDDCSSCHGVSAPAIHDGINAADQECRYCHPEM